MRGRSASDANSARNAGQLAAFSEVRRRFPSALASLAASAGVFLGPEYHFNMVRPGVSLFGGGPLERADPDIQAVATLTVDPSEGPAFAQLVLAGNPSRVEAARRVRAIWDADEDLMGEASASSDS